ncbi:MAG: hypothetical protein ACD_11C00115G0020 [uncultured bacterium]|nr:MAG: hypothetical protein ACD_11C00115G0020 [uncultured bacterium]HBR72100.1 hypothetical protein [Candidatus Moranbacteria bacterium]
MFNKINKKYWIHNSLILIVGIMGVAYSAYLCFSIHNAGKESLLTRVNTISQFITAEYIALLNGSEEDLNNPAYMKLKNRFMSVRSVNSDVRFIYLIGMKNEKAFFYIDSENVDSPDYSPPGQQYDEASDLVKKMFQEKTNGFEIAGDRWGMWASAMVPIVDSESGKIVALLGMDVPARKYITDILVYCLSAILFALLVILLLVGQKRAVRHMCLVEETLKANNLEIMNLNKVIEEKEQKIDEIKKKISEI